MNVRCVKMPYDEIYYQRMEEDIPIDELSKEIAIAIKKVIDDPHPKRDYEQKGEQNG